MFGGCARGTEYQEYIFRDAKGFFGRGGGSKLPRGVWDDEGLEGGEAVDNRKVRTGRVCGFPGVGCSIKV